MLRLVSLIALLFVTGSVLAQTDSGNAPLKDTLPKTDSLPKVVRPAVVHRPAVPLQKKDTLQVPEAIDTLYKKPLVQKTWTINSNLAMTPQVLKHHPYFGFAGTPVIVHSDLKTFTGKEVLFYVLIGFLLAFAFLRQAFPKYFNDLVRLLFRTTLKQKQIREQLMQTPLPSLLLNTFFAFSAGLYIDLLLQHFGVMPIDNFWLVSGN